MSAHGNTPNPKHASLISTQFNFQLTGIPPSPNLYPISNRRCVTRKTHVAAKSWINPRTARSLAPYRALRKRPDPAKVMSIPGDHRAVALDRGSGSRPSLVARPEPATVATVGVTISTGRPRIDPAENPSSRSPRTGTAQANTHIPNATRGRPAAFSGARSLPRSPTTWIHSTFGRSGQIAPHGSLSLRACLRAQSAGDVRGERKQLCAATVSADQISYAVASRASAFQALDARACRSGRRR